MKIAIIGSGISGMYAAHRLHPQHEITLFEANSRLGGHTNTVDVNVNKHTYKIDTGFIVFNEKNYPNFFSLLNELGVASEISEMSFSFKCERSGLEYNGSSLGGLFAQKRNLIRPTFYKMILDIMRFNRGAKTLLNAPSDMSMGEYLDKYNFSGPMVEDYLLPMAGAIWSSEPSLIREFPARQFGQFFMNHGLMQIKGRPQWRTVSNGAKNYLEAICKPLMNNIRLNSAVKKIERFHDYVLIEAEGHPLEKFDQVIIAAHSNQALRMLNDPSKEESEILGAIPYHQNDTVLHTDKNMMPKNHKAWAAWNYHRPEEPDGHVSVTYNLSTLQKVPGEKQFLVTLNGSKNIDKNSILKRFSYEHPIFNAGSMAAQKRWGEINGQRRTWYCGAYWGYGFHEDGVKSAIRVCEAMEENDSHEKLHLPRNN
jgi:uncharacterized protein